MFGLSKAKLLTHFNFHKHLTRSLMANASPARVSASFSAASPVNAPPKRVGTHNGSFHCDEALGCFMIRLTDKFSNAEIVRTRDPQVWWLNNSSFLFNFFFVCVLDGWEKCSIHYLVAEKIWRWDEALVCLGNFPLLKHCKITEMEETKGGMVNMVKKDGWKKK